MIGRKKEINELNTLYFSNKTEFVAIYGRRRIGKTFLVSEVFKDKFTFKTSGVSPIEKDEKTLLQTQLHQFAKSLKKYGSSDDIKINDWFDAFLELEKLLDKKDNGTKQVVFIDELPWFDTPRSNFISAFESFYNSYACYKNNILLIVCGSSSSWILNKLINNHQGLYNRLTYTIRLMPFSLKECKEYFLERNCIFSDYDIAISYMVTGGIPYYLGYYLSDMSIFQNIDNLLFNRNCKLELEYDNLFSSIFVNPNIMKSIIEALTMKKIGLTREEICTKLKITDGGTLTNCLRALINSDFIQVYQPLCSKKTKYYRVIDPLCIFYNKFKDKIGKSDNFFKENFDNVKMSVWRGIAFENVVLNHIKQIKYSLGIIGVNSNESTLYNNDDNGIQVDLLIERKDNVTDICEIKFYNDIFAISKDYDMIIRHRMNFVKGIVNKRVSLQNVLITTFGLKKNEYSNDFSKVIILDDLFAI